MEPRDLLLQELDVTIHWGCLPKTIRAGGHQVLELRLRLHGIGYCFKERFSYKEFH